MTRTDWFNYADPAAVAAEYAAGPQDLVEIRPGQWGIPGIAHVCCGDRAQMRKVQAKRFADRFERDGFCPLGNWTDAPKLPSVAARLKEGKHA